MDVNTSGAPKRVWWEDPDAVDNVDLLEMSRGGGAVSGDAFGVGTWPIMYKATDRSGNIAWCNFTITVHRMCKYVYRYTFDQNEHE